jgi:hypothetical protein
VRSNVDVERFHLVRAVLFGLLPTLLWAGHGHAQIPATSIRDEPAPGVTLTQEQQVRRKALIEQHIATRLAVLNASERQIRGVLEQCRSAIQKKAVADHGKEAAVRFSDATASRAGGRFDGKQADADIERRWVRFSPDPHRRILRGQLDLAWEVIVDDAAGGTAERLVRYECGIDQHLTIFVR